jgi:hypothetical protein
MTNVLQQDARLIAMDAAIVTAIRLRVPEFEVAYVADSLPRWFQRRLDRCTAAAEHVAATLTPPLSKLCRAYWERR